MSITAGEVIVRAMSSMGVEGVHCSKHMAFRWVFSGGLLLSRYSTEGVVPRSWFDFRAQYRRCSSEDLV
jgi:hypothetical protein